MALLSCQNQRFTVAFSMKRRVVFAAFCVLVSLSVVFFIKLDPVLRSVHVQNSNKMEQLFSFHKEDRLERTKTTKAEKAAKTSGIVQGLIMLNYSGIKRTTSTKEISQTVEDIKSRKFAARKNLIILSPGRGGSSFLGAMFNSNPQIMFWFEPLRIVTEKLYKAGVIMQGNELINFRETCVNLIDSFFKCDFSNISNTTLSEYSEHIFRRRSKALTSGCLCPSKTLGCLPFSDLLLKKACNSYKHTVIKVLTSRVPNKTIQSFRELFQQQNGYDVKLILLVRDPRAVIYSRIKSVKWIKGSYRDSNFRVYVHGLCDPIEHNIRLGLLYPPPWLKDRFKVVRYEDLAVNTVSLAQELYRFAGFDWSKSVDKWISAHDRPPSNSTAEITGYSLHRNASDVIDKWKNAPGDLIRVVEDVCSDLMNMLGYDRWINRGR